MSIESVCEYILSRISEDLLSFGYKRSGKGKLFYRYSADRKIACGIEMQKKMFNSPEGYYFSFTFNISCIALYEVPDFYREKLTLAQLKSALEDLGYFSERLGHVCKGSDYWWEITDETLRYTTLEEYYNRFLHDDIIKCAHDLDEQAIKKEKKYYSE